LETTVHGHEDLTRPAVVAADGRMPFPLIGEVQVRGLTPTELEARLCQLPGKDYLVDPQVSVTVREYGSQKECRTKPERSTSRFSPGTQRTRLPAAACVTS
jgi:polysaccharide biosynthesis/export protein